MLAQILLLMTVTTPSGQPTPKQPSDYTPAAPSQVVSWQLKRLPPPSAVYISVDDVLRAAVASSQANEVVTVSYRWIRAADGKLDVGQFTIAPAANRTLKVVDQPLAEGFLLSISCKAAVATTRGQTFVRLFLNPKALGAGQPGFMLMADYVTTAMAPGHPNGRILAPSEGPGNLYVFSAGAFAVGTEASITVPTNARWRVIVVVTELATDAAVGNRQPFLQLQPTVGFSLAMQPTNVQAPSTDLVYYGGTHLIPPAGTPGTALIGWNIPLDYYLLGGGVIGTSTGGLDGGDQYKQARAFIEEWLDNV